MNNSVSLFLFDIVYVLVLSIELLSNIIILLLKDVKRINNYFVLWKERLSCILWLLSGNSGVSLYQKVPFVWRLKSLSMLIPAYHPYLLWAQTEDSWCRVIIVMIQLKWQEIIMVQAWLLPISSMPASMMVCWELYWRTMPGRDFNYKVSIGKLPSLI